MSEMEAIADLLETKRKELDLSYRNIGEKLDIYPSTVHRWFTKESNMNVCHVTKICRLFNISPNELFNWNTGLNNQKEPVKVLSASVFETMLNVEDYATRKKLEQFKEEIRDLELRVIQLEAKEHIKIKRGCIK